MAPPDADDPGAHPILFFDGECVLCNCFADFVMSRDAKGRFRIASLQGETARALGAGAAASEASAKPGGADGGFGTFLLRDGEGWSGRSDAALRVLVGMGGVWRAAWPLFLIPRSLRDTVYDFIARNRYRWFGKRDVCRVPAPAERDRFLP